MKKLSAILLAAMLLSGSAAFANVLSNPPPFSVAQITAGSLTLSKLATQATNTILGNATSGTASPTALAIGSCSTASSAVQYTTNSGWGCNTSITAAAVPASGIIGLLSSIGATFNGGGSALVNTQKAWVYVPWAGTINSNTIICDQSGSVAFDIKTSSYAGFPGSLTSIVASAAPTVTSAQNSQDATLTGWTSAFSAGTVVQFSVTSATTVTNCSIVLKLTRT